MISAKVKGDGKGICVGCQFNVAVEAFCDSLCNREAKT